MNVPCLRFVLLSLCLVGASQPALAEDAWVAHFNANGMAAVDKDTLTDAPDGPYKQVRLAMYLPERKTIEGYAVDYVLATWEFDCATPGRSRSLHDTGYRQGRPTHEVDADYEGQRPWNETPPPADSMAMSVWNTVCAGAGEDLGLDAPVDHDATLLRYRAALQIR